MFKFILGTIFGIIISTVGFGTLANVIDVGVKNLQNTTLRFSDSSDSQNVHNYQ